MATRPVTPAEPRYVDLFTPKLAPPMAAAFVIYRINGPSFLGATPSLRPMLRDFPIKAPEGRFAATVEAAVIASEAPTA